LSHVTPGANVPGSNIQKPLITAIVISAAISLAAIGSVFAQPTEFSEELARLESLAYSGSREEISERIEQLEPLLDDASPRERVTFILVKARAAALDKRSEEALDLLDGLLQRRDELASDQELRVLNLATNLLVVNDRFEAGFEYFREALALAPGVDAATMRADTYSVAAEFHARIGEYSTAIEYANQSMQQVEREVAPRVHCVALERRARAALGSDRLEQAVSDYRTAVELCESIPDLVFAGISRLGLATAFGLRGDPGRAEANLRTAIDVLETSGFMDGVLEARYKLAEVLLEQGRTDEASRVMAPTMQWIDTPGSYAVRAAAMQVHARLAEAAQDKRQVYEFSRRALAYRQQHTARIRHMRFTLLMSAHDDRAREREVELLRSKNSLAELNRESRRQEELALTFGGFGALIAGILLLTLLVKAGRDRQMFQRLSQRDGLTGLYNHTRFFELAQQDFLRARQSATPFSLIVADVDLFKQVNDVYGHLVGDSVLERIGVELKEAFGPDAIIGRLGGEEFGIALIDCDIDTTVARIEHFRAMLNRRTSADEEPVVTMSFGVAELSRERSLDVLYAYADQALYDAKDAGRNRVITVARINLQGGAFVT